VIKHIDLIAIGALLCGIALYSQARDSSILQVIPQKRIALAQTIQRAVRCSRAARASKSDCLTTRQIRVLPHVTLTGIEF
jgi:hypothetical protein